MKIAVKNLQNEQVGEIELNESIFGLPARKDILHRAVLWQLAKRRAGTHKTKTVGEISGSNRKPFKQKGTGRARQGSARAAQFRGGQTTFGPTPRSHETALTKKLRKLALRTALSVKAMEGKVVVLDEIRAESCKTKSIVGQLAQLGIGNALIIGATGMDQNFLLATRNLPHIDVLPQQGANVYDILRRDILVLSQGAIAELEGRLK